MSLMKPPSYLLQGHCGSCSQGSKDKIIYRPQYLVKQKFKQLIRESCKYTSASIPQPHLSEANSGIQDGSRCNDTQILLTTRFIFNQSIIFTLSMFGKQANASLHDKGNPSANPSRALDQNNKSGSLFSQKVELFGASQTGGNPFGNMSAFTGQKSSLVKQPPSKKEGKIQSANPFASTGSSAGSKISDFPAASPSLFAPNSPSLFSGFPSLSSPSLNMRPAQNLFNEQVQRPQEKNAVPKNTTEKSKLFDSDITPSFLNNLNNQAKPLFGKTDDQKMDDKTILNHQPFPSSALTTGVGHLLQQKETIKREPYHLQKKQETKTQLFSLLSKQNVTLKKSSTNYVPFSSTDLQLKRQIERDIEKGRQRTTKEEELVVLRKKKSQLKQKIIAALRKERASVVLENHCRLHKLQTDSEIFATNEENKRLIKMKEELLSQIKKLKNEIQSQLDVEKKSSLDQAKIEKDESKPSIEPSQSIEEFKSKMTTPEAHSLFQQHEKLETERDKLLQDVDQVSTRNNQLRQRVEQAKQQQRVVEQEVINIFENEDDFRQECLSQYRVRREELQSTYCRLKEEVKQQRSRRKQVGLSLVI